MSLQMMTAQVGRSPLAARYANRGDPGLFGGIVGAAKGFITGGIGGAVSGGVRGLRGTGPGIMATPPGIMPTISPITSRFGPCPPGQRRTSGGNCVTDRSVPVVPTPGVRGAVQRALPGGATGYEVMMPGSVSGYHLNKTDYFLRDGTFVPAGTKLVKNRRRNPLNPRAASRAISRLESAKKAASRMNAITIRKTGCGCKKKK